MTLSLGSVFSPKNLPEGGTGSCQYKSSRVSIMLPLGRHWLKSHPLLLFPLSTSKKSQSWGQDWIRSSRKVGQAEVGKGHGLRSSAPGHVETLLEEQTKPSEI